MRSDHVMQTPLSSNSPSFFLTVRAELSISLADLFVINRPHTLAIALYSVKVGSTGLPRPGKGVVTTGQKALRSHAAATQLKIDLQTKARKLRRLAYPGPTCGSHGLHANPAILSCYLLIEHAHTPGLTVLLTTKRFCSPMAESWAPINNRHARAKASGLSRLAQASSRHHRFIKR